MDNSSTVSTQNFPKLFKPSPAMSKKQDTECSQKTFVSMGDINIFIFKCCFFFTLLK